MSRVAAVRLTFGYGPAYFAKSKLVSLSTSISFLVDCSCHGFHRSSLHVSDVNRPLKDHLLSAAYGDRLISVLK